MNLTDKQLEWLRANTISHEEHMMKQLQDPEYEKMYLDAAIQEFIEEGNYNIFFKSLERVVKSRTTISDFSKKTGITRKALYDMFKGERMPRFDTVAKILKELGITLRAA